MQAYVGIDVSKKWLDLAMFIDGECKSELHIDNERKAIDEAIDKLKVIAGKHEMIFGCEASGQYYKSLIYQLHDQDYRLKVINPRYIHHEKMSQGIISENDKVDASVIARRLYERDDRYWQPADEGNVEIRDLLLRRNQLKNEINREKNRRDRFTNEGACLDSLERSIKFLKNELDLIEKQLKAVSKKDVIHSEAKKAIRSIGGVGYYVSLAFTAKIGTISRFRTANEVVKYLGLAPHNKESGSSVHKSRMSKTGDVIYRKILYMAAVGNTHRDNVFGKYYQQMIARGRPSKTAIAAVMRKMTRVMFAVWRDNRPFSMDIYGNSKITLTNGGQKK